MIFAAVHVGGVARSNDAGKSWQPTFPIEWDVHEVCAQPTSGVVAAATALGLAVSRNAVETWERYAEGPRVIDSLAVAALEDEILLSVQDGPFTERSQVWRWSIADSTLTQVRDGLPEWLTGKVDTQHIACNEGRAAIVDRGGTLWLSSEGSRGWRAAARDLGQVSSVQILA